MKKNKLLIALSVFVMAIMIVFATGTEVEAASKKTNKKAVNAYKTYLKKSKEIKYFNMIQMGNDGTPVLVTGKRYDELTKGFLSVDVYIYDSKTKGKVKYIGNISSGYSGFAIHRGSGRLSAQAALHDRHEFNTFYVKNKKLYSYSMMDGSYGHPDADYTYYKYVCTVKKDGSMKVKRTKLKKQGTVSDYTKFQKKYCKKTLSLKKNTKTNRNKIAKVALKEAK